MLALEDQPAQGFPPAGESYRAEVFWRAFVAVLSFGHGCGLEVLHEVQCALVGQGQR